MIASQFKFCLITPSYKPDFERCRLLANSIDRFALSKLHHYIIVDRRDLKLFQQLANSQRTIVTVESILPWWIQKIPLIKNGWFSYKTLPIRNWLIQQIVKIEIAKYISEDILIFVDSDLVFVRPFSLQQFVKNGKVRLFRRSPDLALISNTNIQKKWSLTAASLLGLPVSPDLEDDNSFIRYVGNFITWKRDNVLLLHQHIERVTQQSTVRAIASKWHFSEYMLYGMFVDRILKDKSDHYWDSVKVSHEYWGTTPLNQEQLQEFLQNIADERFAVMISAKSQISVADYASLLDL